MKIESRIFSLRIVVVVLIIITVFSLRSINQFSHNTKWLVHTHEVNEVLARHLSIMQDVETGMRDFVITGKADYLEPYNLALSKLQTNISQLRELAKESPIQQQRIDTLEQISNLKIFSAKLNIRLRQEGGFKDAREMVRYEKGKKLMDDIRAINLRMQKEEEYLLDNRTKAANKSLKITKILIVSGGVFSIIVVIILMFFIRKALKFEKELIKSKERAEELVGFKDQFLSNMSHEIRTPMNAIIGFTKVVLKTDLSAKQKEYLTAIKMSGDALIVLINDILDLAKVDAGKMTFEQIPFKMALSIAAMLHLFETKIQEKNLVLVKEYDSNIPEVLIGDPVRLHQIILNLVSNAIKFTPTGKITVNVHLLKEDEEKVTIEFSIADTGIGIPENKLEYIFENFQQAYSDTSRLYGGTGLGLAIVKKLVEPQGGTISVKSKVNEGSTFSFILSFKKTKIDEDLKSEIMELDTEIKNLKVLVVEDIALNQLLMKTILDDYGFECDIVMNGKLAIEKLQAKPYHIVLMDLHMPVMNGFEATEFIRHKLNSEIPIIALTADVTTVDLAKCKAVGMNDYIAKPIDEKLLYTKIVGFVKPSIPMNSSMEVEVEKDQPQKIKCINLDYLARRTKSNPELIMQMISIYLEQTPPLIIAMKQSLQDKDWRSLYLAVHKMIPSFSIIGISIEYENMAKKMQEYASAQKNIDEIPDLVLQLENICNQACKELEEELKGMAKLHES